MVKHKSIHLTAYLALPRRVGGYQASRGKLPRPGAVYMDGAKSLVVYRECTTRPHDALLALLQEFQETCILSGLPTARPSLLSESSVTLPVLRKVVPSAKGTRVRLASALQTAIGNGFFLLTHFLVSYVDVMKPLPCYQ